MRVALAHDWLHTKLGGAEQVLSVLAELFPEAPIYTLIYNPEVAGGAFDESRIVASSLQKKPAWLKKRPRYLLPFIPAAVEGLDFRGYDLVISSSGAWMKNVITPTGTHHLCYCHSPMRFVWDYWPAYLDEQLKGPVTNFAIRSLTSYLRLWDASGVNRVDRYLANSETTAARIKKFYGVGSRIIYPPVELSDLEPSKKKGDYLLTVGALTPYKKWDLAIAAANRLNRRLIIVGDGADRARLETLAGPTVEFAGRVARPELARLFGEAQALIHPQEEDFGISAVEALASGTPVVAYRKGGATEIVDGETGIFFDPQTPEALESALEELDGRTFDPQKLTNRAQRYDRSAFEAAIKEEVAKLS